MANRYLRCKLRGVMMYFCSGIDFDPITASIRCNTHKCPSKRAMVGLIGACLGISRNDSRLKELENSLIMKYRVVREGTTMKDFQSPSPSDYDKYACGKKLKKYIEYLTDYKFDVYISGDEELLKQIHAAFFNPVYMPYLGKKCCFISEELADEDFNLIEEENLAGVCDCP